MSQIDDLLKEELQLQRIATGLINKGLYKSLDDAYEAVRLILLGAETIASPAKLKATERAISKAINEALTKGWSDYTSELQSIAIYDSAYYAQLIGTAAAAELTVPAAKTIQSFIDSALMSLSRGNTPTVGVWADFVRNNIDSFSEQVNNLVKAGYVNNATVGQMTRTIKQFNDGLAKQQAEILARTGLRHYTEQAREAMALANLDIIEKRYYLSVFDNRRTITCASLHGRTWDITDDSYVRLPAHYGCRSIYLFLLKGQKAPEGKTPAIGSGKNYPEDAAKKPVYKGRKSSASGKFEVETIPVTNDVGAWLREQDRAFVVDNLGAKRAKLFLDGNLPIDRMADAWGRELTLAELAARNNKAFELAGVNP